MDRRKLVALLGGTILVWPLAVRGREPGRTYRIGLLTMGSRDRPAFVALFDELSRLGFVEGRNLQIDGQGFGLRPDQFAQDAAELAKAKVDVILCAGPAALRAAQQATATIPILGNTDDMVGEGLVASMAHPGGNTTGISMLATELDGKRQELLIELLPGVRRIAALVDALTTLPNALQPLQDSAHARGVELVIETVRKPEEIAPAIAAAKEAGAAGLNVMASALLFANRRLSSSARQHSACPPCTNGLSRRTRAALSRTARASSGSIANRCHDCSLSFCAGSSRPICRSSSRRIGAGRQPEDREGARHDDPGIVPRPRRRSDRMIERNASRPHPPPPLPSPPASGGRVRVGTHLSHRHVIVLVLPRFMTN